MRDRGEIEIFLIQKIDDDAVRYRVKISKSAPVLHLCPLFLNKLFKLGHCIRLTKAQLWLVLTIYRVRGAFAFWLSIAFMFCFKVTISE